MAEETVSDRNSDPHMNVAFQGQFGAYSHLACREGLPEYNPLPCRTFEDAFAAELGQFMVGQEQEDLAGVLDYDRGDAGQRPDG